MTRRLSFVASPFAVVAAFALALFALATGPQASPSSVSTTNLVQIGRMVDAGTAQDLDRDTESERIREDLEEAVALGLDLSDSQAILSWFEPTYPDAFIVTSETQYIYEWNQDTGLWDRICISKQSVVLDEVGNDNPIVIEIATTMNL